MSPRRRRKKPAAPGSSRREVPIEDASEPPVEETPVEETPVAEAPVEEAASDEVGTEPTAEEKVVEVEDRLRRLQAEFVNETKRIAKQAEDGRKYAVEKLVADLLPVFDSLHSARQGLPGADDEGTRDASAAMREGIDLVEKELLNVLGRHGVERIDAVAAAPFDPNLHEAVYVVDHPELEPNQIAQILRPGFTLHGRVVRPAHVAVTRAPSAEE